MSRRLLSAPASDANAGPASHENQLAGGRYRLGKLLGSGSSGRVYQARDEVAGGEVAVKILAVADTDHDAYRRFVREARLGLTNRHPNIVAMLDFRADLGFTVMELFNHGTSDRIGSGCCRPRNCAASRSTSPPRWPTRTLTE